jgi:hypothetical protein
MESAYNLQLKDQIETTNSELNTLKFNLAL